ncbi:hypothetical protein IWQ61_009778 [Dispira simplex]|nr:hypothetical protein IWQ61_009778 [Dispira simplex]
MKLTRFTTLSIIATYLLGSVWATGGLFDPQCTQEFCAAMLEGLTPQQYDSTIHEEELKRLHRWTDLWGSIEECKKMPAGQVAAVAKLFLLERKYLTTAHISQEMVIEALEENPLEPRPYRYFIIVSDKFPDIRELTTASDARDFAKTDAISEAMRNDDSGWVKVDDSDDSVWVKVDDDNGGYRSEKHRGKIFRLNTANPVESKAAEYISEYYKYSQSLKNLLHPKRPNVINGGSGE